MSKNRVDAFPSFQGKCIHEIFETVALQNPDAIALIHGEEKLTYRELDQRANQLAHYLRQKGAGPEVLVAICMERSVDMFIGLLGILKSGAAYVPLDFHYPKERLSFLLQDTSAPLLLTQSHLLSFLPAINKSTICCIDQLQPILDQQATEAPQTGVAVDDLMYTIYTSGSTGQPKGVQVEHRNVVNLIEGQLTFVRQKVDRFLYAYSFAFDGAVLLIYWTLLDGGTLVIAPEGLEKDIRLLADCVEQQAITHLLTFPSVYNLLLEQANASALQSLQSVSVAGEACPAAMVRQHHKLLPGVRLLNQYGPTEATVGATICETQAIFEGHKVPIGKPIDEVVVYLLDEELQAVKVGETGEIFIGGKGVARGYLHRPQLTAERFLADPFAGQEGARMYRTGDLARRLPDGQLDFIGRADLQVKLRGYRIELGEVEAVILQHPPVREVAVVLRGDTAANQKLVAYVVAKKEEKLGLSDLRSSLQKQLPEYMLPAIYVPLSELPLAPSGKVDRKALPAPPSDRPALEQAYEAPRTDLQRKLTQMWTDILGIAPIGIHDRFFELGGNSLQAAQFINQLQKELQETIFIVSIFDAPTIDAYAMMLERDYASVLARLLTGDDTVTVTQKTSAVLKQKDFDSFSGYVPLLTPAPAPEKKNRPAIFILAPPRSGTTLLRVMLAGHPDLFAANELQLLGFHKMTDRQQAYQGKFSLWGEGLIRTIMELQSCDAEQARQWIRKAAQSGQTTQQVYAQLQEWIAPRLLVDKSPSYALDPSALQKAEQEFDGALYIHLVRHPYAMASSFVKMHMEQVMYLEPHPYDARQTAELIWTKSHQNILDFLSEIPAGRQFRLSYEDLVRQPKQLMQQLCAHLKIDYHEDLILPYQGIEQKMTDGIYADSKPMGDVRLLEHGRIDPRLADKWKGVWKDNFLSPPSWELARYFRYPDAPEDSEQQTKPTQQAVAIVGLSLRVPGADNPETFWQNLLDEKDVSREFSREELLAAGISVDLVDDPDYVRRGMPLDDAECFDASFFGIHPKEAALMDPQHRIFLEQAHAALERAGCDPSRYHGRIAVFGGVARNTYLVHNVLTHPNYFQTVEDFTKGTSQEKDFPATRVAYRLNLRGPAVNVQTACSSSGVSVHLACQSLLQGDSDMVLVGGGRIQPPLQSGHVHTEGHALSPDGYCRAFDASAQGMVRGNGMAFIVLKRLEEAVADKDNILAVIRGSAINNDGSEKIGFTAPGIAGQSTAIQQAYERSGVHPETVSYIEAHGTGTRIGDPIEVAGLTKAFRTFTDQKQFCAIGSVKTNIGHLDAGACLVGIIKTVLALQKEQLPASLHFQTPNPQIPFADSPFFVNDRLRDWKRTDQVRRAGVSSFGLGGTNAHIILEEAPLRLSTTKKESKSELLIWSAKQEEALHRMTDRLATFLSDVPETPLADVAFTLGMGRQYFSKRAFIVGADAADVERRLVAGEWEKASLTEASGLCFLFPGGGAQHSNMGLGLYNAYPVFRDAVDECLEILQANHQLDLREVLFPPDAPLESNPIRQSQHAICLLFAIEYATARLWMDWGLQPSEMIGHSLGEYTAACLAGVFSLEDALAMVSRRGELFLELPKGGMLSVALSEKELQPFLEGDLDIAAINKPGQCVVSGSEEAIERIRQKLEAQEVHCSVLQISVAAHSREVEPILESFGAFLKNINFHPPSIPIVSNVTGDWVDEEEVQQASYWLRHLRQTVRFSEGIERILELKGRVLLEVGPGQTLSTFSRQHPARSAQQSILASLRHPREKTDDVQFFLTTAGRLWMNGFPIDKAFDAAEARRTALPSYPFDKQRHWIDPKPQATTATDFPFQEHLRHKLDNKDMNAPRFTRKELLKEKLKDIFHQLSGIPQNDMKDQATFLEMGFDSLFLTQATNKIKKQLKVKLSFRQLLEEVPNLAALAGLLDEKLPAEALAEEVAERQAPASKAEPPVAVLPKAVSPAPVATPIVPMTPIASEGLEGIVQQQLRLMEQQLQLLGARSASSPLVQGNGHSQDLTVPPPAADPPAKAQERDEKMPTAQTGIVSKKEGAAHGPWKPIDQKKGAEFGEKEQQYLQELITAYTQRTKGSQQLAQQQRKKLADPRSITGFHRLWKDMVYQIAVERSKGAHIWDVDGNRYVDFRMAFGISLFGHSPDFIQEAVRQQLDKGFELGVNTPLAKKVAELLAELTGMERVTLVNTGSEAISASVRAARMATGKDRIAVFEGDYHGIADEMLVRSVKRNGRSISLPVSPGIPSFLVENVLVLNYHDPGVLQQIEDHADDLAAVIIEPVQPNNPHQQHGELLHRIRELTQQKDIALLFDEMITGFRVAPRGAQQWYGVEADIVAYGKIISGGLPMAAVAGKARFMDCFDGGYWTFGDGSTPQAGVTFFGGTFVKHPLSLAASYAALSEIKARGPKLYEDLNAKTARFAERIKELFVRTKVPLQVLSTASVVAIKVTDSNPLSRLFFYYLKLKGVHLLEKAGLVSTAHTEEDLDFTLEVMEESIREMQMAGFFKIHMGEPKDHHHIVYPPYQDEATTSGGVKTAAKKKLPLTEGQQEVWVEQRLGAEAAAAYNLSSKMLLDGPLDVETLKESIQQLTDRHEALRCHFDAEETVQHILSTLECDLPILDLSGLEPKEREAEFAKACEAETAHPLDLFEGPLVRWRLLRLSSERHCLLMTAHHAIADGWALGVLFNDLARIFAARQNGQTAEWEPAEQLSEFVAEERAFQQTDSYAANQSYWAQQFADGVPLLELPTDRLRPVRKTYDAKIEKLHLSEEMISQLKEVAAKEGTTLFILLYTAFQTLLHRLSRQEEFVLGLVASGQAVAGFDQLVAHAVNLLPVRTSIHPDASFQEHLKAMRPQILDAFEHQRYSLGALVRQLKLPRDPGRQPMISVLFNMDSPTGDFQMGHLRTELSPIVRKYETFDSFINVKPLSEGACFEWIYNTDLFDSLSIQRRLAEFHCLLQSIIADPSQSVSRLNILPDTEQQLLQSWQYPRADYPRDICVHQWISQQARQHPNRIALASGQKELRYDQLEDASKRLAENLVAKGIQKGDFVGVFFDRSTDLVISLLACMKAGAIYVPLDPANPLERLQVIMEDVQANFLLTHQPMKDRLPAFGGKIIFYEQSLSALNGSTPPLPTVEAHEYAYINYTSGSSGRPKGVLIPHRAVIDHHLAIRDALELDHNTVNYGVASIAFDPSVQDFFLPLMIGGRTIVSPEAVKTDGFLLKEELERFQPSLMQATPSTWRMLLAAGWRGHGGLSILSGGEGLTRELAKQLLSCGSRVYNIYGPTETTIWSSLQLLTVEDLQARPSSGYEAIGHPISNVALYLLDEHKQQVPIGVPGELYIGGEGVAPEGYFKRADLNVEKFVENPFGGIGGPRLYRSGDMARYLPDGRLEYLQRADNQVKVRGFRIELGEVESALAQHPEVRENVVVIRNDQVGEQRLVAYVVASNGHPPTALMLKEFLQQKLPDYMLPTAYVQMKEFPLTASQKVNRNALPVPDLGLLEAGREREEARTETEKWLLAQWSELLGMQALGVTDNFFELGGHSLIAIQLMARIREEKGFVLPLAVLLEHPSIRQLARLVDEYNQETSYSSLIAIKASGSKPPIYLVHGAGLHVLMYEMLSRYMDEEQPIYALQARGLDGKEEPLDAIEDIAAHYLSEILQQNPEGPYAIAGYSFGGLIAFEMARQLQKMGKEMAMLGVFDTVVRQSITGQAHNGYYQQLSNLGKKVAWNISLLARRPLDGLRYKSKSLHRRWKRWKYQLLQADAKTEEQAGVEEFGARVDQKNKLAFERYRITAYDGDLHLFRAVERRFYVDDFEYLGWHPFIEGEISIHEVPGDHLHLFNPPHGETFAKTLQQTLDRCFQQDDLLCQYDTKLKSLS